MENASKALIIAGAILISILIIGLGVFIYNKAKGAMDDSISLDSQKVQSINAKFEAYEGKGRSASDVKALLDLVRTHNNQYTSANIAIVGPDSRQFNLANEISTLKTTIDSTRTYTIKIDGYHTGTYSGLINKITISQE